MKYLEHFYIGGAWVAPAAGATFVDVVNPATEKVIGQVPMGTWPDADRAVSAARAAFRDWSRTSREARAALLARVIALCEARADALARAITTEMGAPAWLARECHVPAGLGQMKAALAALQSFAFVHEPIGVVALVTPWNWPLSQIAARVAPALAAGCTVVLMPSEIAPLDARLFAQILHDAGVPEGVFNMLHGDGALARHPEVKRLSITASAGKTSAIVLDDVDLRRTVTRDVIFCMMNSGQTHSAPTRLLVPAHLHRDAAAIAAATANALNVGNPLRAGSRLGPIAHLRQYEHVQQIIQRGIDEGATLVAGGTGRPAGLTRGFYARPTVFAHVRNDMSIAREAVFGPVVSVMSYRSEEEAIEIANDTASENSAYVSSADPARACRVAAQLRAGTVSPNRAPIDPGEHGLSEFVETKSIAGCV